MDGIFSAMNVLSALGGLLLGTAAAYLNMRISKRHLSSGTMSSVMGANMLRMLIDVLMLLAAYLVSKHFGLPMAVTLISVALGLSVGGMLFLSRLAKGIKTDERKDGGE